MFFSWHYLTAGHKMGSLSLGLQINTEIGVLDQCCLAKKTTDRQVSVFNLISTDD
jgi:hypothetical protein